MTHSQVMIKTIWCCINKQMVDVTIYSELWFLWDYGFCTLDIHSSGLKWLNWNVCCWEIPAACRQWVLMGSPKLAPQMALCLHKPCQCEHYASCGVKTKTAIVSLQGIRLKMPCSPPGGLRLERVSRAVELRTRPASTRSLLMDRIQSHCNHCR